jgi:hypothetical protein
MDKLDLYDEILDESYDHIGEGVIHIKLFIVLAIISAFIFIFFVFYLVV